MISPNHHQLQGGNMNGSDAPPSAGGAVDILEYAPGG